MLSSGPFSSDCWRVPINPRASPTSAQSDLRTLVDEPPNFLLLATTKKAQAPHPLLIKFDERPTSAVPSSGNNPSSGSDLLYDSILDSTPKSCSGSALVSVSSRCSSSLVAAPSQQLVQYGEGNINRDDLFHKTIDNLISLLLSVLLCCLLSCPAVCLLLIVFWLLFEPTIARPTATSDSHPVLPSGGLLGSTGLRGDVPLLLSL
ncbi:hypothetical protein FKP32DRAFT_950958 [Trametes sanguinea]|nr:hypothetical protein FKP32DRAFT_950958 [Trametes sanguinea]